MPDAVYEAANVDEIADRLTAALNGIGEIRTQFHNERDTYVFIHGNDAEEMFTLMEPILYEVPLFQNTRVLIRYGKPSLQSRELKLPFHAS